MRKLTASHKGLYSNFCPLDGESPVATLVLPILVLKVLPC